MLLVFWHLKRSVCVPRLPVSVSIEQSAQLDHSNSISDILSEQPSSRPMHHSKKPTLLSLGPDRHLPMILFTALYRTLNFHSVDQ